MSAVIRSRTISAGFFVAAYLCAQQPARSEQPIHAAAAEQNSGSALAKELSAPAHSAMANTSGTAETNGDGRPALLLDLDAAHMVQGNSALPPAQSLPDAVIDEVTVTSPSHHHEAIPRGVLALPWAATHPSQAWRILTPVMD